MAVRPFSKAVFSLVEGGALCTSALTAVLVRGAHPMLAARFSAAKFLC